MRILCVLGQHNHGDPERGNGYEFTNFLPAFRRLGHEVLHFDNRNRDLYNGYAELNRSLLETIERERPHLVFAVQNSFEIWVETWQLILRSGLVATVNWTTDD